MTPPRLAQHFLRALEKIQYGTLQLRTPEDKIYTFSGTQETEFKADLHILSWKSVHLFYTRASAGFGEAYRDGLVSTSSIADFMLFIFKNQHAVQAQINGRPLFKLLSVIRTLLAPNNRKNSQNNISFHYDIGNDFYRLWLDKAMHYSSAIFDAGALFNRAEKTSTTLETAQTNKCSRILDTLDCSSGRMLEIGCGWGGFAEQALHTGDFAYKGITISKEQHNYAKDRLAGSGDVVLEDYRDQQGAYEAIVSIEMFEAVGKKYWLEYFQQIRKLLAKNGKAVVQTITIDEPFYRSYASRTDFIREFIFPGGFLPTATLFEQYAKKAGLKITEKYSFGRDYATTLGIWLDRFTAKKQQLQEMGFDDAFMRVWSLYLAACRASFAVGENDVSQFSLERA